MPDTPDAPLDTPDTPAGSGSLDEVFLLRGGHRFAFPCPDGGEAALIAQLGPLVEDPACPLTWYDAALLCHQLRGRLSRRIDGADSPLAA